MGYKGIGRLIGRLIGRWLGRLIGRWLGRLPVIHLERYFKEKDNWLSPESNIKEKWITIFP